MVKNHSKKLGCSLKYSPAASAKKGGERMWEITRPQDRVHACFLIKKAICNINITDSLLTIRLIRLFYNCMLLSFI
jgi:hypothetical protein